MSLGIACLLPSTAAFMVGSRASVSLLRRPPVAYATDEDALFRLTERLEQNVLNETEFQAAASAARAWLEPTAGVVVESHARGLHALGSAMLDTTLNPRVHSGGEVSMATLVDSYEVTFNIPGIAAADVTVCIEDGLLTFSGESSGNEDGSAFHSRFLRAVRLPADADGDVVSTTYEDDKVRVTCPKIMAEPLSVGDELASAVVTEAEALAAESPRFARWLKAHGYLRKEE